MNVMLLNLYSGKGEWNKIIERGELVLKKDPKNYAAYMIMGLAYKNLEKFEDAKKIYERALEFKPRSKEIQRALEELEKVQNT